MAYIIGNKTKNSTYRSAFIVVTMLFFMWGFITCMNDILIPYLRKMFELSRFEVMLVQGFFFGAYFIGSLIYFFISVSFGDPIQRITYKRGIIAGLILSAIGCALFYPAAELKLFSFFLISLFLLGLGFTLLQIAANPYVAILGKPETASGRLNLSQGFNSFGTTIAPIIGGYLVFHFFARMGNPFLNKMGEPILTDTGNPVSAAGVEIPYLIFACIFILIALIIQFTRFPVFTKEESIEKGPGALKFRHLKLGIIAIFFYVGGEVSIGSAFINFLEELLGMPEMEAKSYLAMYWGGLMIGRFLGAVILGKSYKPLTKFFYLTGISLLGFFVLYFVIFLESGMELKQIIPYLAFIVVNIIGFYLGRSKPARTLLVFSLIVITLLLITMGTKGQIAMWALIGIGLFNSIMWSNIFTLSIKDLGKYTSQGSSLLIMAILGGALLPMLQGGIADLLNGFHYSFFIPLISYIYLAFYGWKGHKVRPQFIKS